MKEHADITVLVPNYNHAHFLPECLDAIFSQSFPPREVIVIDDASQDQSLTIIREYQKKYPELCLIQNDLNQGPAVSLNIALQRASGRYIAFCAADDLVLPHFFEECSKWLDRCPEVGIACSDPSFFKNEKPYRFKKFSIYPKKAVVKILPDQIEKAFLFTSFWIPSHASLFRRDLVLKYGGFIPDLRHLCDWYLNLKIALLHGIIYIPSSFGAFRVSTQSYGAQWNRFLRKKFIIYKQLFSYLEQEDKMFSGRFQRAGVLGLIHSHIFIYLFIQPTLWKFIAPALFRKACNLFRKLRIRNPKTIVNTP